MGARNITRLLQTTLVDANKFDLASGDVMKVLPIINDQGAMQIGDGTNDMDLSIFLGSSNEKVVFDVGNSRVDFGVDNKGVDVRLFGETASAVTLWDQSADQLLFDNTDIQMGDNDEVRFGDATGGDIRITWDASRLTSGPAIAQSTTDGLWSGCPSVIDPNPYQVIVLFDDFLLGNDPDTPLALWVEVDDAGTGTNLPGDIRGGSVKVVTAAADNDYHAMRSMSQCFNLVDTKALWFEARFRLTEAATNDSAWWFGLTDTLTTGGFGADATGPLGTYDGVLMWKDEDTLLVDVETSNASTQDTETNIGTFVSGNWTRVGFHLTAAATTAVCHAYVDLSDTGTMTAHSATMNLTRSGLEEMHVVFGVKAGPGAGVETLEVDYIKVVQER